MDVCDPLLTEEQFCSLHLALLTYWCWSGGVWIGDVQRMHRQVTTFVFLKPTWRT